MAATGETPDAVCTPPARVETILPDPALAQAYAPRIAQYRLLNARIADVIRQR
jgi:xylulokinase